jgi:creatinine amidohydrolase
VPLVSHPGGHSETPGPHGPERHNAQQRADQYRLEHLTWPQVEQRAARGALLAIPVGATEQHGPHLPLSTDTELAVHLACALAARRGDVLVAPALPYGSSGEHRGFAGTLSIGREATRLLLVELLRSATDTFERVLLVVGHGGNADPVNQAVALLHSEGRDVLAWAPRLPGDAHAGRTETSMMLAVHPERVHTRFAALGTTTPITDLMPDLQRSGVLAVSPSGVLGDPTTASATHGQTLLATAFEDLQTRVERWVGGKRDRGRG